MLYMLALSQSAGGVQVVNDRRAVVLKLPDETAPEDALGVARGLAAAADPINAPAWAGALGGFMSNDSLDLLDGVLWLNVNPETPPTLDGDPDEGGGDLPATSAIVADGQAITTDVNGTERTLTPTVADNAITGLETAATVAVVANAGTVPVQNSAGAAIGTGTLAVAGRAVTSARLPATIAGVANSAAVPVLPASGSTSLASATAAVAAGAITGVRLPATAGVVTDGQTLAVTGGTVTLTVAANAVTAEFTPE